jgi:hypothetical protein
MPYAVSFILPWCQFCMIFFKNMCEHVFFKKVSGNAKLAEEMTTSKDSFPSKKTSKDSTSSHKTNKSTGETLATIGVPALMNGDNDNSRVCLS